MKNKSVNLAPELSNIFEQYRSKGEAAYKKYGVHHLSKSSVDNLLDCSEKFVLKSRFYSPGKALILGSALHEIQEDISSQVSSAIMGSFGKRFTLSKYETLYPETLEDVLSDFDLAALFMKEVTYALKEVRESGKEVVLPVPYHEFKADIYGTAETITKSLRKDHLRDMLKYPVLNCEMRTVYLSDTLEIPYDGYLDLLVIDKGKLRVEDLKTTFSRNNYIWDSLLSVFQLWLYAQSLVQMGYCAKLPRGGITRLVIDTKPRAKVKPSVFDVTVERKILDDLSVYDRRFRKLLSNMEEYVKAGVAFSSMPTYGCKKCGYEKVCTKKYYPDWKVQAEETAEGGEDDKS